MSSFPDGRRPGKGVDKSNFTQTCNLLSQFLKHKRTSASLPFTATKTTEEDTTATGTILSLLAFVSRTEVPTTPRVGWDLFVDSQM